MNNAIINETYLIKNATLVNEGDIYAADALINDGTIKAVEKNINHAIATIIDQQNGVRGAPERERFGEGFEALNSESCFRNFGKKAA